MPIDREPWLEHDQDDIPGAGSVVALLHARPGWQIHSDSREQRILIAKPQLMDRWITRRLVDRSAVRPLVVGDRRFKLFVSPSGALLAPIPSRGEIPRTPAVATSLAVAFRRSRRLDPETSFARGIYSACFSAMLPVPAVPADAIDDELHFGTWLCGGLAVSTRSFSQLANLVDFLSPEQLARVLRTAGLDVPDRYRPDADSALRKGGSSSRGARPAGGRGEGGRGDSSSGEDRYGRSPGRDGREDKIERCPGEGRRRGARDYGDDSDLARRPDRDGRLPRGEARRRDPLPRRARGPEADRVFRLPGRRALEKFFNEHIVEIILSPDKYKRLGVDFPAATILHGPPGSGKTYAVDRLVEFIEWPVNRINSSSVASPYIHDTSKKISQVFDKAIKSSPSILVIDEMEAYLSSRQMLGAHQHQVEEVGEFLRRIPEALDRKVLIIGMTNMMDSIDQAILRQGRFDYKIKIELPDREEVQELLKFLFSTRPFEKDLDLAPAVDALTGKPLSDAAFVVREASRLAARDGREAVDSASLAQAILNIPPSKLKKDIGFMAV
ncbi:MAG: AAA family ATPase [Deltaproteobacteria bacterium]|jgi:hypothetical protein|nr:AAA family ATPase [Deltaproteobacteria bacterium]